MKKEIVFHSTKFISSDDTETLIEIQQIDFMSLRSKPFEMKNGVLGFSERVLSGTEEHRV